MNQAFAHAPIDSEHQVERVYAEAGHLNYLGDAGGIEAAKARAGLDVIERGQLAIPTLTSTEYLTSDASAN